MHPSAPRDMDLWILAGQSNMVGRAPLRGALGPHDRVWNFGSDGRWDLAREPLHRVWESFTPAHQELLRANMTDDNLRRLPDEHWAAQERAATNTGAGLGIAFGTAMTEAHGRPVGLIPCAHGGVSLEQWNPAHAARIGSRSLYGAMLERVRRARETGVLKGVLWYQGETDAIKVVDAGTYARRLDDWIAATRSDTGVSELPVVVVQIGRAFCAAGPAYEGIDLVRQALAELPHRVTGTAATTAIDLGLCDRIHLGTAGLIRVGRRMARLALRLTDKPDTQPGPFVKAIETTADDKGQHAIRVVLGGLTGHLAPSENISGFAIHTDEAHPATPVQVWSADVRTDDDLAHPHAASVRLLLSHRPSAAMRVSYGQGMAPCCNLADAADMPLCAFAPRPIRITQ